MIREALFHHANSEWGYVADKRSLTLLFRAAKHDTLTIDVIEYNRFQDYRDRRAHPMMKSGSDALFAYYKTTFVPANYGCIYYFRVVEGTDVWFFGEYGLQREEPVRMGAFEMPRIQDCDRFEAPAWMQDAIFYQIFPDRFCRVGPADPTLVPWGEKPTWYHVFGGNFRGIESKIPHLVDLGVNAVYMTPISLSPSCHRYDTTDYLAIDPRLGTEEEFKLLVDAFHEAGIRIVLDAVFNHCGAGFFAFQDVLKNQENSIYKDWFLIDSFPIAMVKDKTYQTFASEMHMPKLNSADPGLQDHLIRVGKHFIERFDIDGWRLDVADEVDSVFWRRFRRELKAVKPDLAIIGEVWHNSDYYLRGDQFDSVQNYQFYEIVDDYFLRRKTSLDVFSDRLTHLLTMYPDNVARALLNQIDSHDVPRAKTQSQNNVKWLKLAILFQFTFIGMPCVYYGSELGMEGGYDPDNRRTVDWDPAASDQDLFAYYKRLARWRKADERLRRGSFRILPHETLFVYERTLSEETVRIVVNHQDHPEHYACEGADRVVGACDWITIDFGR
ncbi:MAG TPA: alpha-glycosidase [Acholeplasmatales bacterium]|nr:alpha-glycosidase [Acholeplasmatales bacterium]